MHISCGLPKYTQETGACLISPTLTEFYLSWSLSEVPYKSVCSPILAKISVMSTCSKRCFLSVYKE